MDKKKRPEQPNDNKKVPFFARYLVAQELSAATGGRVDQTLKFPSDNDEEEL